MDNLILTLLSIPKVGKKTIDYFIEHMIDTPNNENEIVEIFNDLKNTNKRIIVPSIEQVKIAIERKNEIVKLSNDQDINIIDRLDSQFPRTLRSIPNAPIILFYKGNYDAVLNENSIAIVGSRKAKEEGLKLSYDMGKCFGREGYTVVSGLAIGCDEYAHKGCLDAKGKTVAVLPGGLDSIYPIKNRELAEDIVNNGGCLISEYPVGISSFKNNFIERDRIQSGLSSATLVIEAELSSGTMHTVEFARNQERIIACCNVKASGNKKLIEENCISLSDTNEIKKLMIEIEKYNNKFKTNENIKENYIQSKFKI